MVVEPEFPEAMYRSQVPSCGAVERPFVARFFLRAGSCNDFSGKNMMSHDGLVPYTPRDTLFQTVGDCMVQLARPIRETDWVLDMASRKQRFSSFIKVAITGLLVCRK